MTNDELQITNWSYVTLKLYDLYGRELAIVFTGEPQPGHYHIHFDASRPPTAGSSPAGIVV